MGYFFIALTILLTLYGQLVMKWQISLAGPLPAGFVGKLSFLIEALLNPWVLSGLGAAFVASLCWMLALSKLPLSTAYPLTATNFFLIFVFSAAVLGEPITWSKVIGTSLIIVGVVIMAMNS